MFMKTSHDELAQVTNLNRLVIRIILPGISETFDYML